ncbi:Transferrin binding protein-like solute binding protein [Sphingopyxis sp. LC81]|uniref:transferrin-binding protein-like solute binding protein n=1 Tax=Sphingopyxis sp. LC81 TaxID=1502850 RepID=UPI00050F00B9|nr:transferrin-binding protein-like solute binding protein [Sphingopyxis sp. LC81]KGB51760.1 Transferrin binding protein-like solute binding protein [Sphingopyxis sp. LC81]
MHYQRFAAISLGCALLSACGGGGGGGGGVNSTSPPPSANANSSLVNLQYSEDFIGRAAIIRYNVSRATGGATVRDPRENLGAQIRYDAVNKTYLLAGTTYPSSTFGPANRDAASSGAVITAYEKVSGNRQENLALFNPGPANTELALTYASYGALQTITDNGATVDVATAFFTYGVQTAASDMPRTGSVNYRTRIDGQYADATGVYSVSGPSSFSANFGAGTIAFSMDPVGQNVVTGGTKSLGSHTMTGSIAIGNQFNASTEFSRPYGSSVAGYFYGPGAAELGGTFLIRDNTGGSGAGAGIVVGKKN